MAGKKMIVCSIVERDPMGNFMHFHDDPHVKVNGYYVLSPRSIQEKIKCFKYCFKLQKQKLDYIKSEIHKPKSKVPEFPSLEMRP